MKKLVLVMVSALIIIIFIAFNYLLWDSENKEKDIENLKYLNINNNSRISAFERDIKSLEEEIRQYKEQIEEVNAENKMLQEDKLKLENERMEQEELIEQKLELINILKQHAELSIIQEPIKSWIEAIDKGNYETAYKLLNIQGTNQYIPPTLEEFTKSYKGTVDRMILKSIKLAIDNVPEEMKGSIIFEVLIDIEMKETTEINIDGFEAGENIRYITVDYDIESGKWLIVGIASSFHQVT